MLESVGRYSYEATVFHAVGMAGSGNRRASDNRNDFYELGGIDLGRKSNPKCEPSLAACLNCPYAECICTGATPPTREETAALYAVLPGKAANRLSADELRNRKRERNREYHRLHRDTLNAKQRERRAKKKGPS